MSKNIIKYLFPIRNPIFTISLAGILFGLRIVLQLFSINLGPTVLSFTWISLFLAGFSLGPVWGYMFGWITDTACFFMFPSGSPWMWEYSIQESLICLLGGLAFICYQLFKDNKLNKWIIFGIWEAVFTAMMVVGIYFVAQYFDFDHVAKDGGDAKWIDSAGVKIAGLSLIASFYVLLNGIVIFLLIKGKPPVLIMVTSMLVIISWVIFSWILGPWAQVRYYQKLHAGSMPSGYQDYGYKYYALSRILKSLFVVPIEISVTYPLLKAFDLFKSRSHMFN